MEAKCVGGRVEAPAIHADQVGRDRDRMYSAMEVTAGAGATDRVRGLVAQAETQVTGETTYEALTCADCGGLYSLDRDEVEWYLEKDLDLPLRCRPCRKVRKLRRRLAHVSAKREQMP